MLRCTRNQFIALALFAAGSTAAMTSLSPSSSAVAGKELHVDMAMDGTSFSFEGDLTPSGVPARGTPFVVEGYLYPGGTLAANGWLSGVHADGSPEFPDLVMGTWVCRGWHLLDGDAPTGVVVATTQYFDLDTQVAGTHTIVSDGIELADFHVEWERAITGGTGRFSGLRGQHQQTYVGNGLNVTGGFNATFVIDVSKR